MTKKKRIFSHQLKHRTGQFSVDTPPQLRVLESAWENLPQDLSIEEREVFYELSSQVIKLNSRLKKISLLETDLTKN
jgi:hypothetical protein